MVGVVILSLTAILVPPPEHLPDLFPLVISVYSCAHFLMFLAYFHHAQLFSGGPVSKMAEISERKMVGKEQSKNKFANKNKAKKKKHD